MTAKLRRIAIALGFFSLALPWGRDATDAFVWGITQPACGIYAGAVAIVEVPLYLGLRSRALWRVVSFAVSTILWVLIAFAALALHASLQDLARADGIPVYGMAQVGFLVWTGAVAVQGIGIFGSMFSGGDATLDSLT